MLTVAARQRFARQVVLAEIGEAGQERLCASTVRIAERADPRVRELATQYLERAGVHLGSDPAGAIAVEALDLEAVRALAGDVALEDAAAALAGSFAAVEAIKAALDVGRPARIDPKLSLGGGAR